ncbi:uncharacterized protein PHALS_14860 [Plasmopara halstedii]|uniref:Uncharacterized protein n=1 Tax=Plasmopara halstedii TaxID=4781 RepID=A0A0P1AXV3_PLAHL|nr:uncharacterized protein PHALS_14860 [Plasmopara halstedii]CEG46038.1 hypothetical protein PHALS_14860 [Plasmopara halstedii]|eukprot:XP_024582407.1 hypothetical protein PHALS_14860 [Plasmopara halstedii]
MSNAVSYIMENGHVQIPPPWLKVNHVRSFVVSYGASRLRQNLAGKAASQTRLRDTSTATLRLWQSYMTKALNRVKRSYLAYTSSQQALCFMGLC